MLLVRMLDHLVRQGNLELIDAYGARHRFGDGTGPAVAFRLWDKALHRRIALAPRLAFGEAYMEGTLTIETGELYDFLAILMGNVMSTPRRGLFAPAIHGIDGLWRGLQQYNPLGRARANVAHHYDLSSQLYDLFLGEDRQYSCAYFEAPDAGLDAAQAMKVRHIAAKLLLEPGQRVLDIGSGWGGLALYMAQEEAVEVTGLTLSQEQLTIASSRAARAAANGGLRGAAQFRFSDYREAEGTFDRIVSVGMFEHVGVRHYRDFFETVADRLSPRGVALIHAIGRADGPGNTNPWMRKYIFPGGYCPALSEVLPAIERAGLWVTDIEILRLHYAETLKQWRHRFLAGWDQAARLYDERFCRMWEFYLAASEAGFRVQGLMVFQIQLAKSIDAVPLTRDYIAAWKAEHPLDARLEPEAAQLPATMPRPARLQPAQPHLRAG